MTLRRLVLLLGSLAATGCAGAGPHHVLVRTTEVVDSAIVERLLRGDPIPAGRAYHYSELLNGNELSAYVCQIADRQPRHLHQHHDLTLIVYRGRGDIFIEDRRRRMTPGHFYHVPRGVTHYCVNTGEAPLVGIVLYSPALDGNDMIETPRGEQSYERE